MILVDGSVRQPHTVIVAALLCSIFGYLALRNIPVQLKPALDKPEIQITTAYRGASPREVEEQISIPIEDQMEGVEGVNRIGSASAEGRSTVTLEFDWGVDKGAALIDVINKLNQLPDLPEEADAPIVLSITSDQEEAIMWIILAAPDLTANELYDFTVDSIEPRLRRVEGVSDLMVFGGEEREMQIRFDPEALAARQITIAQLIGSLQRENMNVRGGYIDQGKRRFNLRTVGQFRSPEDVGRVIVARTPQGAVYLNELAEVQPGFKRRSSVVRVSGRTTVVVGVKRKSGANVVKLCTALETQLDELNKDFGRREKPVALRIAYSDKTYIDQAIRLAWRNLLYGALLASVILIVFLRSLRSLLVVAVSIPVCMITVFIFISMVGRTLNIISLAGLAFSSGMIVDGAIVVIENIYRHLTMGKSALRAARDGTVEVWGAVLISTLTTLAVFIPIMFIQEEAGQLFKDIAIAISLAISLSLIAAITLIPMLAGRVMPRHRDRPLSDRLWFWLGFGWLGRGAAKAYDCFVGWMIGPRPLKILLKLVVIAVTAGLFAYSLRLLPNAEYLPSGNRNLVLVFAKPLVGSNLDKSIAAISPLEQMLLNDQRIERFFVVFGNRFNAVGIIVKPEYAGERQMQGFVGQMFGMTQGLSGFEMLFPMQMSIFRDPGKQLEIDVVGPSLPQLVAISQRLQGQLMGTPGVMFVRSDYQAGSPEIEIRPDRRRSAPLGLRTADIADLIESLVAGKVVGTYNEAGKQIDLTLYAHDSEVQQIDSLARTLLYTPAGRSVELGGVATILPTTGPTVINHVEKQRSITLTVNLIPAVSLDGAISTIEKDVLGPLRATLPSSYSLRLAGAADKLSTTLALMRSSFLLAVLIVYLLMVSLFRSWTYPLIILVTIPLAASGAFLGISLAHRWSGGLIIFDVIAMLGLIILSGIVVNNAILIVHQSLNFRAEGMAPDDALRESCRSRLRPICMSVITSVLGMTPLAMGSGAGTELYRGLGAVVIGGLMVSTVFTLFLVPAIMSLLQDFQRLLPARRADGESMNW